MKRTIETTEAIRKKQIAFNKNHKIKPKGIVRPIMDVMEGSKNLTKKEFIQEVDKKFEEDYLSPKDLAEKIDSLEQLMLEHANKLEFEEAANIRDKITSLKNKLFAA